MPPRYKKFQRDIWDYYKTHKRDLPWRNTKDPYKILVSEVMLQQTQVERVKGYYNAFLKRFPNVKALAKASLADLLRSWKGLGYNRRALNLKKAAEAIVKQGAFPRTYPALLDLPGVGQSTAGAIMNFSYSIPTPFIETNIRSVYLHFFFKGKEGVNDKDIMDIIVKTIDQKNPREWHYALYDYGMMLKKTVGGMNSQSKHYKKQSTFKGSNRELRAMILFYLLDNKKATLKQLITYLKQDEEIVKKNLEAFIKEGAFRKSGVTFMLR
jgi:A/G-specific adenine glycosylase